ncbi:MAG: transposase [Planctomycetes bacterium]|nr:transposase [Planctomycetota bacterium]
MVWIRQLYAIERHAKELTAEEQQRLRQSESLPLLESPGGWLDEQSQRVLPKSPIGKAISYALSNWQAIFRYTEDGDSTIDNILSERTLRAQAIGRKNWILWEAITGDARQPCYSAGPPVVNGTTSIRLPGCEMCFGDCLHNRLIDLTNCCPMSGLPISSRQDGKERPNLFSK